jgi:hypothetical protein
VDQQADTPAEHGTACFRSLKNGGLVQAYGVVHVRILVGSCLRRRCRQRRDSVDPRYAGKRPAASLSRYGDKNALADRPGRAGVLLAPARRR